MSTELCVCGRPLHYTDPNIKAHVESLVATLGSHIRVNCGGKTYLVPRHYIALHGLIASDLPRMKFEEVPEEK